MIRKFLHTPDRFLSATFQRDLPFRPAARADDVVYGSGQTCVAQWHPFEGQYPGDIVRQTPIALGHLAGTMAPLGGGIQDVVKVSTTFIGSADWQRSAEIQGEWFPSGTAWTGFEVPSLMNDEFQVEIETIGVLNCEKALIDPPENPAILPSPAFHHGVLAGGLLYSSMQVGADRDGIFPESLTDQTRLVMENVRRIVELAGATMEEVVKLNTYIVAGEDAEESLKIQSAYFTEGPALTAVVVPGCLYPEAKVAVEIIATPGTAKTVFDPEGALPVPGSFHHGVRSGRTIWVSGEVGIPADGSSASENIAEQTRVAMDQIAATVSGLGGSMDDVIKNNTFYQGGAEWAPGWEDSLLVKASYFTEGPAICGVGVSGLVPAEALIALEAVAVVER